MNRIVITDTAKFEEVITNIENILPSIKDSFESTRKNAQGMSGTNTWKGQSQETLYGKYQQLETNFAPVEETIEMYIRFLKTYALRSSLSLSRHQKLTSPGESSLSLSSSLSVLGARYMDVGPSEPPITVTLP